MCGRTSLDYQSRVTLVCKFFFFNYFGALWFVKWIGSWFAVNRFCSYSYVWHSEAWRWMAFVTCTDVALVRSNT
jgi:hypothetical protein